MKKLLNIVCVYVLVCVLSGCEALDKEPHTLVPETYFTDDNSVNDFLLGVYAPLMQGEFYGGDFLLSLNGGDDLNFYARSTPPTCMMCANTNSSDGNVRNLWTLLYQGINRANMLLENVDMATSASTSTRSRAKAEALFLRAYYHFILVQGWGDVPMKLHSTTDVSNLDAPRDDKQKVYDQIIKDINEAIPNLNDFTANATPEFISKQAVQGILARIWLFRAGECYRDHQTPDEEFRKDCFEHVRSLTLSIKESGIFGLVKPYSRVFLDLCEDKFNSTGVLEMMWEIPETGNRTTDVSAAGRLGNTIGLGLSDSQIGITTHTNEDGLNNPGYSYGFAVASLKLYDMYDEIGDTARQNWCIAPFTYTTATVNGVKNVSGRKFYYGKLPRDTMGNPLPAPAGFTYTEDTEVNSRNNRTRCCAKYRREYEHCIPKNKNFTPINSPILRYADILLMLAEAENELNGPTSLAVGCVDALRDRADAYLVDEGITQDGFRQIIQNERAMELCFEAGLRRFDLIRWGIYLKTMQQMEGYTSRSGWGQNYTYAAAYYRVTDAYQYYPIPETEMAINKAITQQNPGW